MYFYIYQAVSLIHARPLQKSGHEQPLRKCTAVCRITDVWHSNDLLPCTNMSYLETQRNSHFSHSWTLGQEYRKCLLHGVRGLPGQDWEPHPRCVCTHVYSIWAGLGCGKAGPSWDCPQLICTGLSMFQDSSGSMPGFQKAMSREEAACPSLT